MHRMIPAERFAEWLTGCWAGTGTERDAATGVAPLTAEDLLRELDCGLLSRPYVEVYRDGVRRSDNDVYTTRVVQTHRMPGYVNREYVLGQIHSGATIRFPSIGDWVTGVRQVVEVVARATGERVTAMACLAREGAGLSLPARDTAPAVVLQCSGRTAWRAPDPTAPPESGETDLAAGDALYLPPGAGMTATAGPGTCLLLLIEGRAHTARDLVQAIQAATRTHVEKDAPIRDHHLLDVEIKAKRVCELLRGFHATLSAAEVVRHADEPR